MRSERCTDSVRIIWRMNLTCYDALVFHIIDEFELVLNVK